MTSLPTLKVESRYDGRWRRVSINRPKANVLSDDVVDDLRAVVGGLPRTAACRLLSIEGCGAHFSFGAGVEEHLPDVIARVLPHFHALIGELIDAPVVTVAIVRGQCLGGGFEVALACDLIFANDDAVLGVPEIKLGVFPPVAAALLPARIGASRSAQAILSGESRPASDWHDSGLVHQLVPGAGLEAAVDDWFHAHLEPKSAAILRHATYVMRFEVRRLVREVLPGIERHYVNDLMNTADAREGIHAFLDKRDPDWSDS